MLICGGKEIKMRLLITLIFGVIIILGIKFLFAMCGGNPEGWNCGYYSGLIYSLVYLYFIRDI